MKQIKFLQLIKTLKPTEFNKFKKFLNSPYLVPNKNLSIVIESLPAESFHTGLLSEEQKRSLFHKIENSDYNDSKWRKVSNEIVKSLYDFFILEELNSNDLRSTSYLLHYLSKNKNQTFSHNIIEAFETELNKYKNDSSDYYLQKLDFEKSKYEIYDMEVNMEMPSNLEQIHHNLDLFYFTEKIKQLVAVQSRLNFINIPIHIKIEKDIIEIIKKYDLLEHPTIRTYFDIYQLKSENLEYLSVKDNFLNLATRISFEDKLVIIKEIINYCTLNYNQGKISFLQEVLEWYKFGLKHNLIFPNLRFNPGDFLNIVFYSIRTKEFSWTENFIEEYQKIIPKESKKDIVTFSYARLYFNQQKFDLVIEKLRDVEFDELTYNLDAKVLLLATYYEVEEWQAMISLADSFRTYLSRHEKDITPAKKLRYANFIKFIKKISRAQYQDKKAKEKLIEEIQGTDAAINKGWLLEKAQKL